MGSVSPHIGYCTPHSQLLQTQNLGWGRDVDRGTHAGGTGPGSTGGRQYKYHLLVAPGSRPHPTCVPGYIPPPPGLCSCLVFAQEKGREGRDGATKKGSISTKVSSHTTR